MGNAGQKEIPLWRPQTDNEVAYAAKLRHDAALTIIENSLEYHKVDDLSDPRVLDEVVDLLDMMGVGPEYHALLLPQDEDDLSAAAS